MIKIFIVDDRLIISEGVKRLLSQARGIKIEGEAKDGETALQKIGEIQPDVVLLDINLPDVNGLDVAEKINRKFPHIETIILSSNEQESYVKKAVSLGAKGYLSKNVSSQELEWAIELVDRGYSVIKPKVLKKRPLVASNSKSDPAVVGDDALRPLGDRILDCQGSDSVRTSEDFHFPKLQQKKIKTNLDSIEKLLERNYIQQRYAKYKRRIPKNKPFNNASLAKLKKTVASFEFGLLVLIILFSLSFLTMLALSK